MEAPAGGSGSQPPSAEQPQHWRARAAARQRYWSLSHGFQMGRKLTSWADQEQEEQEQQSGAEGPVGQALVEEDGGGSVRKRLVSFGERLRGCWLC